MNIERKALNHIEELLRDAWVWAEGEHKERLSRIATVVQNALEGEFTPPVFMPFVAKIYDDNVVHLRSGRDQITDGGDILP